MSIGKKLEVFKHFKRPERRKSPATKDSLVLDLLRCPMNRVRILRQNALISSTEEHISRRVSVCDHGPEKVP